MKEHTKTYEEEITVAKKIGNWKVDNDCYQSKREKKPKF